MNENIDLIAIQLLENMDQIKKDIENVELLLESLQIKYKNNQLEYSKIYGLTTVAKDIEIDKKEKQRVAWELDRFLFLERQNKDKN